MRCTSTLGLIATLAAAIDAAAGPLQIERLPADCTWVVHVDLERMGASKFGGYLFDEIRAETEDTDLQELGIRLGDDLRDVTLFGWSNQGDGEGEVLSFSISDAIQRVVEAIRSEASYEAREHEGVTVHSWLNEEDGESERLYAILVDRAENSNIVYAASDTDALFRAVHVLGGEEPGIGGVAGAALTVRADRDAYVFISATDFASIAEENATSVIARLSDLIVINMGERNENEGFVSVTIRAADEEKAQTVSQLLQGLVALARLSIPPDDPDMKPLLELANALRFSADGDQLGVEATFDPQRLIDAAREGDAEDENASRELSISAGSDGIHVTVKETDPDQNRVQPIDDEPQEEDGDVSDERPRDR